MDDCQIVPRSRVSKELPYSLFILHYKVIRKKVKSCAVVWPAKRSDYGIFPHCIYE